MNGEMIGELRRLAASDELDMNVAIRLLLSSQAEMINCQNAFASHTHDEYAKKDHTHPWHVITATVATIGTSIMAIWAMLKP